jgi:YD repeat-containing protein
VGSGSWNSFSTSLALQTLACPAGSIVGPNSQCVPLVVTEITASPPQNGNACYGNPIYPLRGSKIETIDLGIDVGWHRLSLTYNNEKNLPASASIATGIEGSATPDGFGTLWYGSLHRKLRLEQGLLAARVGRGGGRVTSFSGNGAGLFAGAPQTNDHLTPVSGGYQFADLAESVIESYSSSGRLLRIDKANGQNLVFTYSATATAAAPGPGYLVEVMDTFGRVTKFNYGADGMVSAIVDPAGRQTGISYSIGNLKTLTWPDQRIRQFVYDSPVVPWALTGVTSENGVRKSTFSYDTAGRAVGTEYAGGTNRFSVAYATPPSLVVTDTYDAVNNVIRRVRSWQVPTAPIVSTPLGGAVALGVGVVADNPVVLTRSQPAGSGCAASVSGQKLDVNGNLDWQEDFNGYRVCYANNLVRNLEVVRVEGLATGTACAVTGLGANLPTGGRKVSTDWHPNWRLPIRIAEPGKITTFVYNGQPDPFANGTTASCGQVRDINAVGVPVLLCKQVEQATTDANGSQGFAATLQDGVVARVNSWLYNSAGQVLRSKGPRTDVNDTTIYEYYADTIFTGVDPIAVGHTRGDLRLRTDALGNTTTFSKYDKTGQILETIDPNGVISTYVYDARRRLSTATTAGVSTLYEYWPTGLVKQVTQADGSYLAYVYDDAHRLTTVNDNLGNSVTYTLDSMGNRTTELVKDPSLTLRRTLGRSIDTLGRIQQITGRE